MRFETSGMKCLNSPAKYWNIGEKGSNVIVLCHFNEILLLLHSFHIDKFEVFISSCIK